MRYVYLTLIVLIGALVFLFSVQNLGNVTITFVTASATLPLAALVLLVAWSPEARCWRRWEPGFVTRAGGDVRPNASTPLAQAATGRLVLCAMLRVLVSIRHGELRGRFGRDSEGRVGIAASTINVEKLAPLEIRVADEVRVRGTTASP